MNNRKNPYKEWRIWGGIVVTTVMLAEGKELERKQNVEQQIQQDKKIAQKMQMKEEEAKMEEAMRIVKMEDRVYIPNHQKNQGILQYLHNNIGSSNIGFTKEGKISEIRINGGQIYKAMGKKEEKKEQEALII